jgi:hypothetical protein
MPDKLKPFIHLVANLYMKHGFKEYPLCRFEQEEVDAKAISNYLADYILRIQASDRS